MVLRVGDVMRTSQIDRRPVIPPPLSFPGAAARAAGGDSEWVARLGRTSRRG